MVKTRGTTGRSGQNRWGDSWPPVGRISGRQWGFPVAAYGENLMATHRLVARAFGDCGLGRASNSASSRRSHVQRSGARDRCPLRSLGVERGLPAIGSITRTFLPGIWPSSIPEGLPLHLPASTGVHTRSAGGRLSLDPPHSVGGSVRP